MQILQRIRNNPIMVLCGIVSFLLIWTITDLIRSRQTKNNLKQVLLQAPPPPTDPRISKFRQRASDQATPVPIALLPKLKPGMSRSEVEQLLGPPASEQVQPVTEANGRLTYCTCYELTDMDIPMTIRPIQPKTSKPSNQSVEAKSHVSLEYDASKRGHPLVEIHYLDSFF